MIKKSVLNEMIESGGKFERRLAELYFAADSENSAKLETAFSEIFYKFAVLSNRLPAGVLEYDNGEECPYPDEEEF